MRLLPLAITLCTAAAPANSQVSLKSISSAVQQVAAKADVAVVQILTRGFDSSAEAVVQSRSGRGSGVFVDPQGHIITNAHVIGTARRVEVLVPRQFEGKLTPKLLPAEVVGLDKETDIAVLKVNLATPPPYLQFADSDALKQGELVLALGSPFGLANSVSMGVVSSVARELRAEDPLVFIQTDAAIHPGNSGGPLVNADGQVVGINTFLVSNSGGNAGVGFAVPANTVRGVYEQILKHGRVRRGQIGVLPQNITSRMAQALGLPVDSGVILGDVASGSAAEAAGLAIRDIVVAFEGKRIENSRQLGAEIYKHAGDMVTLDILREGKPKKVRVTVMERPRDPDRILSTITGPTNLVPKLGVLAVDLDQRVAPLLPQTRRLSGAVIAGGVADMSGHEEYLRAGDVVYMVNNTPIRTLADLKSSVAEFTHGQFIVVHVERLGQLQFLTLEIE